MMAEPAPAIEPMLRGWQVADKIGVNPRTVRRWMDQGILSYIRLPSGQRRIPASALEEITWRPSKVRDHDGYRALMDAIFRSPMSEERQATLEDAGIASWKDGVFHEP